MLYEGLVNLSPTIGARVGYSAAVAEAKGPENGWKLLEAISPSEIAEYRPYWALAGHLLQRMRRFAEAEAVYGRAIGLCEDTAMREFLARQIQKLRQN